MRLSLLSSLVPGNPSFRNLGRLDSISRRSPWWRSDRARCTFLRYDQRYRDTICERLGWNWISRDIICSNLLLKFGPRSLGSSSRLHRSMENTFRFFRDSSSGGHRYESINLAFQIISYRRCRPNNFHIMLLRHLLSGHGRPRALGKSHLR